MGQWPGCWQLPWWWLSAEVRMSFRSGRSPSGQKRKAQSSWCSWCSSRSKLVGTSPFSEDLKAFHHHLVSGSPSPSKAGSAAGLHCFPFGYGEIKMSALIYGEKKLPITSLDLDHLLCCELGFQLWVTRSYWIGITLTVILQFYRRRIDLELSECSWYNPQSLWWFLQPVWHSMPQISG